MADEPKYVYPNTTAVVRWADAPLGRVRLHPKDPWPADDPFVTSKFGSQFFSDEAANTARSTGEPPVERGTRAPGERRVTRRGPGRPPKNPPADW